MSTGCRAEIASGSQAVGQGERLHMAARAGRAGCGDRTFARTDESALSGALVRSVAKFASVRVKIEQRLDKIIHDLAFAFVRCAVIGKEILDGPIQTENKRSVRIDFIHSVEHDSLSFEVERPDRSGPSFANVLARLRDRTPREEMLANVVGLLAGQNPSRVLCLGRTNERLAKVSANELTADAQFGREHFRPNELRILGHSVPFVCASVPYDERCTQSVARRYTLRNRSTQILTNCKRSHCDRSDGLR